MAKLDEDYVLKYILALKQEAEDGKKNRMDLNRANYDAYQLKHDFSHKIPGQSREVLSKVRNATESSKAFFQQALADLDDWFRIIAANPNTPMKIKPEEMQALLNYMLKRADYFSHVGASTQSGLLGSLAISRVRGEMVPKPKFSAKAQGRGNSYKKHVIVKDDKSWELRFDNIRQENYFPDPQEKCGYKIVETDIPLSQVKSLADGADAIYDKAAVNRLKEWSNADLDREHKAREEGANHVAPKMRPFVRITDYIGDIIDSETGDILAENVLVTIGNHTEIIRKPTPNPMWHQKSDIVAASLIEFMNSVWGVAMMDAGTKHNKALVELFNLMLDSGMKSVWGINQIRTDVLEDVSQITDGIRWGTNLKINNMLLPGAKVMESVVTGDIQPEVLQMFNLLNQETLTSMKTNDLRMGAQSMRAVKATEVVAAENSITSEFQGIAKNFEEKKVQPELELATWTICQNWDLIDKEIFKSLFGPERGEELSSMEPQDVFVETINGMKFEVYGISLTLRRQADFRKWTTFLQTISSSEAMLEAFLEKYSFKKLLGEIMSALDLNKTKIEEDTKVLNAGPAQGDPLAQPGGAPGASPDMASQVPSASGPGVGMDALSQAFSGISGQMNMPQAR